MSNLRRFLTTWMRVHDPVDLDVIALVAARNEAASIEAALKSLIAQTQPFRKIIIVINNSTDKTESVVRDFQQTHSEIDFEIIVMAHNLHRKAGALNHGFKTILQMVDCGQIKADKTLVYCQDADTIIDSQLVAIASRQMLAEPKTGGVCSAYRTLPPSPNLSWWSKLLWRLQNIEFGLANAWRVENYHSARVLPGVSVIFRLTALQQVAAVQDNDMVWVTDSLVEDYRLTLMLKDIGWDVKSSLDMISWSDVPLKLTGTGGLWSQRMRWYSGTIDELRLRRLKRHSRYELFTIWLLMINLLMRFVLVGSYIGLIIIGTPIQWLSIFLLLPILAAVSQLYRLKYADQLDKWQILFTATLIVNELYAFYRECIYFCAIWVSFKRPNREW